MDFVEIVRDKLGESGMTRSEFARKMEFSPKHIYDLLARRRKWNELSIKKASDILDIKIKYQ